MFACKEHIDYVMEDFIDEYLVAPTMEIVTATDALCAWCKAKADYELRLEEEASEFAD